MAGQEDKFQMELSCVGLKYAYKAWVRMIMTRVQPNTITMLPNEDVKSRMLPMGAIYVQSSMHHDEDQARKTNLAG